MIELWRTDDHGNDFFIRSFSDAEDAERARSEFEARGRHQTYWLKRTDDKADPHTP